MKIKITPAQEKNLQKLIKYLRGELKAQFSMDVFSEFGGGIDQTDCGSAGCVVGHGPYAGVRKRKNESWFAYSARKFGLPSESAEWQWCFGANWCGSDNTPIGAAARIERLLTNGLPRNWREQMNGDEPLCYEK